MKILRRKAKQIKIGNIKIGANNPVAIQSMTKTRTADIGRTLRQIEGLGAAGCQIVRLSVKDDADTKALRVIRKETEMPLVADIHFNWRFAIEAIDSGMDKIRLNPGNIYKKELVKEIARAARINRVPVRVGLNSGSLPKISSKREPKDTAHRICKSALDYIRILESVKFSDIVVSLKTSNITDTIEAYRLMAKLCDYPFHLGVTACGLSSQGAIKSSIAVGCLLLDGVGDTLRISLTDSPLEEIRIAKLILQSLGLRSFGPQIISCPTCGRCEVNLVKMVKELETKLLAIDTHLWRRALKVAIMGCVVNGPGEAREADLGIAFGRAEGLLFKKGKPIRKVNLTNCVKVLIKELEKMSSLPS